MEPSILEELYAKAIGEEILRFVKDYDPRILAQRINSSAVALLEQILAALDDPALDDPGCVRRIQALVDAFAAAGVRTTRHGE